MVILVLAKVASAAVADELPPESVLPSMRLPSVPAADPTPVATEPIPDETQLPRSVLINQPPAAMPDETTLPGSSGDDPNARDSGATTGTPPTADDPAGAATTTKGEVAGTADDAIDESTPGDQRPILRLNYDGHTGRVRQLTFTGDGRRMVSVGEDKEVHVWQRDPRATERWVHERTLRWQVWRGPRGWIYDVDAHGDQLAIGGYGAMGGTGEIWVVDAGQAQLVRPLVDYETAHRQTVDTVVWSREGTRLVSADLSGRVVGWQADALTGRWQPSTIVDEDSATHGRDVAEKLRPFRGFVPVVWSGDRVVLSTLKQLVNGPIPYPIWRFELRSADWALAADPPPSQRLAGEIPGLLTDMAASSDGSTIVAAAYSTRSVHVWQRNVKEAAFTQRVISLTGRPLFVRLDRDGKRLLVGTEAEPATGPAAAVAAQVQWFALDREPIASLSTLTLPTTAAAGVIDDSGAAIVLAVANQLHVHAIDPQRSIAAKPTQILATPLAAITRVAAKSPERPLRIVVTRGPNGHGDDARQRLETFDLSNVSLLPEQNDNAEAKDTAILPGQRLDQDWAIRITGDGPLPYELFRGDIAVGRLPLDPTRQGRPTTVSTARTLDGDELVIIGTDGQNGVYVLDVDKMPVTPAAEPLPIARIFRGHSGAVRSTSASLEARTLVSGGDDALVQVWSLAGVATVPASVNRWGAEWQVDDGRLVVNEVDAAGPLYFRGVRPGDEFERILWPDESGVTQSAVDAAAIETALAAVPLDTQVFFEFSRQSAPLPRFQMFPAWYPLATVMIDDDRQWAMWTPTGIYNASLSGHRRFGWQINQGLDRDVDFYSADQFRKTLERPEVMRRLIERGSLAAALQPMLSGGMPVGESAIVNQIRSRPRITWLTPSEGEALAGKTLDVTAIVDAPVGTRVVAAKAFLDGIPGVPVANETGDQPADTRTWRFDLPRQTELRLEIDAVADSGATARSFRNVTRPAIAPEEKTRLPQLHLLAIGVGDYGDTNITPLDFPAAATTAVADTFRQSAAKLYDVTTEQLVDRDATRPLWRIYAEASLERLRERVSPDDLVVMYLCGHGLRDRRTGQWYFVTADANFRRLMDDQFDECLSLADLAMFSTLPCRKLAILDSCHSGAVQGQLREDDLKAALRFLQDDVVITLTASEGQQEAAEVVEAGLGRFTARLIEALRGAADEDADGRVTLRETVDFVTRTVAEDSRVEGTAQTPTSSPPELINRLDLPLTLVP